MNKRFFALVLAGVGALALVACKSDTTAANGGGGSGTGNAGGNGGGSGACVTTCSAAITDGGQVCADSTNSATLYDNLLQCSQGMCQTECPSFNMSTGTPDSDPDCGTCLQTNCGTDLTDCSNDA